jgi:hypothetical protein
MCMCVYVIIKTSRSRSLFFVLFFKYRLRCPPPYPSPNLIPLLTPRQFPLYATSEHHNARFCTPIVDTLSAHLTVLPHHLLMPLCARPDHAFVPSLSRLAELIP